MFGPVDPEEARRLVASGESWASFCDMLKAAGGILQRPGTPDDPLTQAEGIRYLTRLTRAALQTFIENADPLAPVLQQVVHETAKMGNDNPDNVYLNAAISGAHTYRLWGDRGSVHWLELATQKGQYGEARGMPPTGRLDARDITVGPDGAFEVIVSCDDPGGGRDWLPMEAETGTLIVRQSWLDRQREVLPTLHLERLGGDGRPSPMTPAAVELGLRKSGMLVVGASALFAEWSEGFAAHENALPRFDQALSNMMGGVDHIAYYHSRWRLEPGSALVIESPPHPCDHWNFQLSNHWMESLDYRRDRIHTNSAIAEPTADGVIRLVISAEDPGLPNWLTTQGHHTGAMCFRWVRPAGEPPEPRCRVVPIEALRG
jgi:hypothetical protein